MSLTVAYVCDAVRTPIGKCDGRLAGVRADNLASVPIRALMERSPRVDWSTVDDVVLGCVGQAGEDNHNVARRSALIANLPESVPGVTVNRLCASSLEAIALAVQAIKLREGSIMIAGGVESASRTPLIMATTETVFVSGTKLADTRTGWLFVNPIMQARFGSGDRVDTAENAAEEFKISREDQDAYAYRSQHRMAAAVRKATIAQELVPVSNTKRSHVRVLLARDEQPRPNTELDDLARLIPLTRTGRAITVGNAAAQGDGACAVLLGSYSAVKRFSLTPLARVVATARVGVTPRLAGMGAVAAIRRVLARAKLGISQMDVIELDELFAAEALAVQRALHLPDDAPFVNPNGGAIAVGHPAGAAGARLVTTAVHELRRTGARHALCAMGVGAGQGIAMILERV